VHVQSTMQRIGKLMEFPKGSFLNHKATLNNSHANANAW
jgi:hypothetical protein